MPRPRRKTETSSEKPQAASPWGIPVFVLLCAGVWLAYLAFTSPSSLVGRVASSEPVRPIEPRAAEPDTTPRSGDAVRVIDGDSLSIGTTRIRLEGVDAPELDQLCWRDGAPWQCGQRSHAELKNLVQDREVRCNPTGKDRYGRVLAKCYVGNTEIQQWMVSSGWAVAYSEYSSEYVEAERNARDARLGIWGSDFLKPSEHRRSRAR